LWTILSTLLPIFFAFLFTACQPELEGFKADIFEERVRDIITLINMNSEIFMQRRSRPKTRRLEPLK